MTSEKKLILALDISEFDHAIEIIDKFKDFVDIFKVGLELYCAVGPAIINEIHKRQRKVFLDLKFHDIPNTVSKAGIAAARQGIFMFTLHASGGLEMMRRCSEDLVSFCLKEDLNRPRILGVTVLTSISAAALRDEIGIQHSLRTQVRHLSGMALKANLDGVVASGQESAMIRSHCGRGFIIVTPGIRTSWTPADDQMRTMTPKQALREGSDYLVMGRAILNQSDPLNVIRLIQEEISAV